MTGQLRASPPERYEEISRHLLEQAQEELDRGDILQASGKVWGATAHAVKAVCQRMGWNHHAHNYLRAAVNYVASELGRDDLTSAYGYLDALHVNYYEHQWVVGEVRVGISNAAFLIGELVALPLDNLPSDQTHLSLLERQSQERLLRMLTRKNQYSHGPQFEGDELDSLPPVRPSSGDGGESDVG